VGFVIVEELADPAVRRAVEAMCGRVFTLRSVLNRSGDCRCDDCPCEDARLLNGRMMNELGGLLERAYTHADGQSLADAHECMKDVRGEGRQDHLAGRAFADWLVPVNRASAHVIVVDRDPELRILMQHRSDVAGVASPGMWSIPGGKVDGHESAHEAALRELGEETGLEPKHLVDGEVLSSSGSYYEVRPTELVRRHLFRADIYPSAIGEVRCLEGQAMEFLPLDEIRTLELTVVAAQALEPYLR
jgi:8-oxo-dGTP diphosphatase